MTISNRTQFIDYCKRNLGWPVVQINIDDDQIEDRVDDALQFFQDYHFDATERVFISHRLSDVDMSNRYIDLAQLSGQAITSNGSNVVTGVGTNFTGELVDGTSQIRIGTETKNVATVLSTSSVYMDSVYTNSFENLPIYSVSDADAIAGVYRIFPVGSGAGSINMFDLRYQLRLNDLYDFTSASYQHYVMTQQHLRTLELLFVGEEPIRFNRKQNRLYIEWDWGTDMVAGEFVIIEASKIVNPNAWTKIWNDRFLKRYATALIKKQWGTNMKKFGGIQLPGGIVFSGKEMYDEAVVELDELEKEMQLRWEMPLSFEIG